LPENKTAAVSLFFLVGFTFGMPALAGEADSSGSNDVSSPSSSQSSSVLVTPVLKKAVDKRLTEWRSFKKLSLAPSEALCLFLGERISQASVDKPLLCDNMAVAETEVYIRASARAQGAPDQSAICRHFFEGENHGIVAFMVEVKPKEIEESVAADDDVPVLHMVAPGAADAAVARQVRARQKPEVCKRIGVAEVSSQNCQGKSQKYYEPHGTDRIAFTGESKIAVGTGRMLRWYKPLVELASNNPDCLDTVFPTGADGKLFLLAQKTGRATICAKDVDGEYIVLHFEAVDELDLADDMDNPAHSQSQSKAPESKFPDIDRPALAYGIWMKGYNYKISKNSAAKVVSNQDLTRVIVPDPSMTRVTLLNPRSFLIEPLRVGATTIFVSDRQGKHARIKLVVLDSSSGTVPLMQPSNVGTVKKKRKPVEVELWEGGLKDVLRLSL
jgi:hypothetical protein